MADCDGDLQVKKVKSVQDEYDCYIQRIDPKRRTGKAKDLPYEILNYDIYDPQAHMVGFTTDRPLKWLTAFELRYTNSDKLSVEWYNIKNSEKLVKECQLYISNSTNNKCITIHVYLTTGVISFKGSHYRNIAYEFPHLLLFVNGSNSSCEIKSTDKFIALINNTNTADGISLENNYANTPEITQDVLLSTNTDGNDGNQELSPSRINTIKNLKEVLADVESRFTMFKSDIEDNISKIQHNTEHIQDKLIQTSNSNKATEQLQNSKIENLLTENEKLKREITNLHSFNKKLERNYLDLLSKQQKIASDVTSLQEKLVHPLNSDSLQSDNQLYTPLIPCSNTFDILANTNNDQCNPDSASISTESTVSEESIISNTTKLTRKYRKSPKQIEEEIPNTPQKDTASTAHQENTHTELHTHTHTGNDKSPKVNESKNVRTHKENITNHQPTKLSVLFLCDSNGKFLDMKMLYPEANIHYIKCPTLTHAEDILRDYQGVFPDKLLIHTGTNDLEHYSVEEVSLRASKLLRNTANKFSRSEVLFSQLLPRIDELDESCNMTNDNLSKNCHHLTNVSFIDHSRINKEMMFYDYKHLNKMYGVKLFAQNLKRALYGSNKTNKPRSRNTTSFLPRTSTLQRISQEKVTPPLFSSYADAVQNVNNGSYQNRPPIRQMTQTTTNIKQLLVQLLHELDGKF